MFKKIKEKILQKIEEAKRINEQKYENLIAKFNDEIAKKTQWSPLKKGGTNFKTHNLFKHSLMLMQYKISAGAKVFLGVFGVIGFSTLVVGLYIIFVKFQPVAWFILLFGTVFFGVSVFMYRTMGKPIIFDQSMGFVYKGFKQPKFSGAQEENTELTYFSDIHAIQIIEEYIHSDKSRYYSYELNLVLKDANRVNIIDHGNYQQIAQDAQDIAKFIGVPIWDAVK